MQLVWNKCPHSDNWCECPGTACEKKFVQKIEQTIGSESLKEGQTELKDKIEFIKGAFQCFVGYESTSGLERFLESSKFKIVRKEK